MKNVRTQAYLISGQKITWTDKSTNESKTAVANLGLLVDFDSKNDLTGKVIHPFVHADCDITKIDFAKIGRLTLVDIVIDTPDGKGLYVLKSISVKG